MDNLSIIYIDMVGSLNPSERYSSTGMIIPNIRENKKCSKPPSSFCVPEQILELSGQRPSEFWFSSCFMTSQNDGHNFVIVTNKPGCIIHDNSWHIMTNQGTRSFPGEHGRELMKRPSVSWIHGDCQYPEYQADQNLHRGDGLYIYIYVYIRIYTYICICIYIYIHT